MATDNDLSISTISVTIKRKSGADPEIIVLRDIYIERKIKEEEEEIVITSDKKLHEMLDKKPEITQYRFPDEEEYRAVKKWSERMKKLIGNDDHHSIHPAVLLAEFILSQKKNNPSNYFLWHGKPRILLTEKEEKVRKLNAKENSALSAIKDEISGYYSHIEESEILMGVTEITVITEPLILLLDDLLEEMLFI